MIRKTSFIKEKIIRSWEKINVLFILRFRNHSFKKINDNDSRINPWTHLKPLKVI